MKLSRIFAAALVQLGLATAPALAGSYSALYVFGDSLSDVGNVYLGTGGAEPAAPYVGGQFSNGPVWSQDFSHALGLGTLLPSLAGGTDFAFGGATTGFAATLSNPSLVPTLAQQVGVFLAANGNAAPSSALYSVWIGSNDVLNIVSSGVSPTTAAQEAQGAAGTEAGAIAALAAKGAKNFLVPLVADLGHAPTLASLGAAAAAAGTALSAVYDTALEADLASLAATPGIALGYLDTYTLLDDLIASPASFGFNNATKPCYVGPYTGGGSVCATPDSYVFWDSLHPTAAADKVIATAAYAVAVPEPATLALLATGLAAVAARRRRQG
jgi:phospholipase/lecithinase/hemolysin